MWWYSMVHIQCMPTVHVRDSMKYSKSRKRKPANKIDRNIKLSLLISKSVDIQGMPTATKRFLCTCPPRFDNADRNFNVFMSSFQHPLACRMHTRSYFLREGWLSLFVLHMCNVLNIAIILYIRIHFLYMCFILVIESTWIRSRSHSLCSCRPSWSFSYLWFPTRVCVSLPLRTEHIFDRRRKWLKLCVTPPLLICSNTCQKAFNSDNIVNISINAKSMWAM